MRRINKRKAKRWLVGSALVLVFASSAFFSYIQDRGKLKVVFFDIGQGDAVLIRTPNGDDILIDGGPNSRVVQKLGEYLPFFDKDIELVILTHPHADHLTGLIDVMERYDVEKVLTTDLENPTAFFKEW
ncbi:MAG: MBL fold metallo-hydrolase [Patescibacteria group bacterium]|nr:MBL fold metallo-hydrolase [Patescibacteria group bacterium]